MNYIICAVKYNGDDERDTIFLNYQTNENLFTPEGRNIISNDVKNLIALEESKIGDDLFFKGIVAKPEKENIPQPSVIPKNSLMDGLLTNLKNTYPSSYGNDEFSHLRGLRQILCTAGGWIYKPARGESSESHFPNSL